MIVIDVPVEWFLSSNDRGMHWAPKAKRVAALRDLARLAAHGHPAPTGHPTLVSLTVQRPKGGRLRDADNAQATWKPLIDGFVDAGLFPDDSQQYVLGPLARLDPKNRDSATHYTFTFAFTS